MTPVGKLALIKTFDKSELLKAMIFYIIPALIGPVLGPLIGGYMVIIFLGIGYFNKSTNWDFRNCAECKIYAKLFFKIIDFDFLKVFYFCSCVICCFPSH